MDKQVVKEQFDQDHSRAIWTTSTSKIFAELLVGQIAQGNRPNNIFNKKAWKYVQDEFHKQTSLKFDRQQLKNHLDVLRKRYNYVKALLEQNGFSWDATRCMVIADDNVWIKYIQAHPDADTIRKKGCPIYLQLCMIFSDSGTEDKNAVSNSEKADHQMGHDHSRANWTEPLEKIFADLMLEQVLQGNKSNNAFSKNAWKSIHEQFNRQTGLKFYKQQLKSRHGVLRRLYFRVNSLLEQNGFAWDRSQCMVIAEDEVWEKHIRVHPEIEAIRVRGCSLYELLGRIFLDPSNNGNYGISGLQTASSQMDNMPSQDQANQDQSRAMWTPTLDKVFVDLLVKQTQQCCASNKKAWKRIREQFNQEAGLKFDEQQLRNHLSVLRRWYNSIKSLLDQNGFNWNESWHLVVDDDEMWENYIKAHPEIETIITKDCPIFKQLCILFSKPGAEGKYVQSSHDIELDQEIVIMDTPEVDSICTEPVADEVSSCPAEVVNTSDGLNMRRTVMPLCLGRRGRKCTETSDTIGDAMLDMESATKKRAVVPTHSGNPFSISSCIKLLNEMQGVEQDLYLSALDLFQDTDRRETFTSIKSDIRMAWLKGKCNSVL